MSPTICVDMSYESENNFTSGTQSNESSKVSNASGEQRAKRKMSTSCDDSAKIDKKRKRSIMDNISSSSSSSSASSMSSSSDDYGTDSELIEINQHKNSYRYESSFMCSQNCTFSGLNLDDNANVLSNPATIDQIAEKTMGKITNSHTKLLFDIAISTFKLAKTNREFQVKLLEFQTETKNFFNSVLENPENQSIKDKLKLFL